MNNLDIVQNALDTNIVVFDEYAKPGEFTYRLLVLIYNVCEQDNTKIKHLFFPEFCSKYMPDSLFLLGATYTCTFSLEKDGLVYASLKKAQKEGRCVWVQDDEYSIIIERQDGRYMLGSF